MMPLLDLYRRGPREQGCWTSVYFVVTLEWPGPYGVETYDGIFATHNGAKEYASNPAQKGWSIDTVAAKIVRHTVDVDERLDLQIRTEERIDEGSGRSDSEQMLKHIRSELKI